MSGSSACPTSNHSRSWPWDQVLRAHSLNRSPWGQLLGPPSMHLKSSRFLGVVLCPSSVQLASITWIQLPPSDGPPARSATTCPRPSCSVHTGFLPALYHLTHPTTQSWIGPRCLSITEVHHFIPQWLFIFKDLYLKITILESCTILSQCFCNIMAGSVLWEITVTATNT